ncbi:MAG: rhodanese-like domain-containing protein [Bacteroidota bacterium]
MRHLLLGCCLALCALLARADIVDIEQAELGRLLQSGVPLVDVRTQPEWEETGIIGGSRLLTFFDERGRHDEAAWLEKLKPIAKANQPVILICRSGKRSLAVSRFLTEQAGYTRVYNVKNGIQGWIAGGGSVAPAARSIAACRGGQAC